MPSNDEPISKTFGIMYNKDFNHKTRELKSTESDINQHYSTKELSVCRVYTIDVDMTPQWIVSSIDKRIFLCDTEGEVRVFSYSRSLRRQPLLTEHFRLTTMRLISSFTATQDYLVAFETDTQTLTLHTHHGGILLRLTFPYDPIMMARCDYYKNKNRIWACSHTKGRCYQFHLNHTAKQMDILDEIDFTEQISNILIDPVGVSTDEQNRIAIHDANPAIPDRLLLFTNQQSMTLSLDFVKYIENLSTSLIERVILVPKQPHLVIILYASKLSITSPREIVIVDISFQPAQILYCLSEVNGVQGLDVTLNNELVYTVPTQKNKRIPTKMHIYSLFN
jgi:hypothetical protein